MDISAIVADAVAKALADATVQTKAAKTAKPTCEKVATANKAAEKAGYPSLLTKSKAQAKKLGFKTVKDGSFFECRDCGTYCRTYKVLLNSTPLYASQVGAKGKYGCPEYP